MEEETLNNIIEEIEESGNEEFSEEYKESWNEILKNRSFFPDICKILSKITNILPQISLINMMNDAFVAESRLLSFQQLNLCICFLIDFMNNNGASLENEDLRKPLISLMTTLYRFILETGKLSNIHINILKTMRDPVHIPQKKVLLLILKNIVIDVRDNDNFMTNIGYEKFKKDFKQKQIPLFIQITFSFLSLLDVNVNEALDLILECFSSIIDKAKEKIFFPSDGMKRVLDESFVSPLFSLINSAQIEISKKAFKVLAYLLSIPRAAFENKKDLLTYLISFVRGFPLIFQQPKNNDFILPVAELYLDISRLLPLKYFIDSCSESKAFFLNAYEVTLSQFSEMNFKKGELPEQVCSIYLQFWSQVAMSCSENPKEKFPIEISNFLTEVFKAYFSTLMSGVISKPEAISYFESPEDNATQLESLWPLAYIWPGAKTEWIQQSFTISLKNMLNFQNMETSITEIAMFMLLFASSFEKKTSITQRNELRSQAQLLFHKQFIKNIIAVLDVAEKIEISKNISRLETAITLFENCFLCFVYRFTQKMFGNSPSTLKAFDGTSQTAVFNILYNRVVSDLTNFARYSTAVPVVELISIVTSDKSYKSYVEQNKALTSLIVSKKHPDFSLLKIDDQKLIVVELYEVFGSSLENEEDAKDLIRHVMTCFEPNKYNEFDNALAVANYLFKIFGLLSGCKSIKAYMYMAMFTMKTLKDNNLIKILNKYIKDKKITKAILKIVDFIVGNGNEMFISSVQTANDVDIFMSAYQFLVAAKQSPDLKVRVLVIKIINSLFKMTHAFEVFEVFKKTYARDLFIMFYRTFNSLHSPASPLKLEMKRKIAEIFFLFTESFQPLFYEEESRITTAIGFINDSMQKSDDLELFDVSCKFTTNVVLFAANNENVPLFSLTKPLFLTLFDVIVNRDDNLLSSAIRPFFFFLTRATSFTDRFFTLLKGILEEIGAPVTAIDRFVDSFNELMAFYKNDETDEIEWPDEMPAKFFHAASVFVTKFHFDLSKYPILIVGNESFQSLLADDDANADDE